MTTLSSSNTTPDRLSSDKKKRTVVVLSMTKVKPVTNAKRRQLEADVRDPAKSSNRAFARL